MNTPTYDKGITALLVVDPYNDFISEGEKIWPGIKAVAEAQQLRSAHDTGFECRAADEASRHASPIPSGRLRDLEIPCAHPEGGVAAKDL